ncbi:type II toxin-antitoxin system VapC family toxin [Sphingomonas floccifaciens]|uniref:Type II toxin-antitoxin system VapC family toxin n=1 Tax=Sphingomonas floccifaciens TaxID=1844115 RepID=A0ABW4NBF3_9SPHN
MTVVDASLATKLLIEEPDSDLAHDWFRAERGAIIAPDLIAIEVAQAVVRRVNERLAPAEFGRAAMRGWTELLSGRAIEPVRMGPENVERASAIAMHLGHPVKDCLYLALAIDRRCRLITCDRKFVERAHAIYPDIALLADVTRA